MKLQNRSVSWILTLVLLFGIMVVFGKPVLAAEKMSFKEAVRWGINHNRELNEIRYNIKELENNLKSTEISNRWRFALNSSGKYIDGLNNDEMINLRDNAIENGAQLGLGLSASKNMGDNHRINSSLQFTDTEPLKLEDFEDKYTFNININSNLYPVVPSEKEINKLQTKNQLKTAKDRLKRQISSKKIEWLNMYLKLSRYSSQINTNRRKLKEAERVLEETISQKEIGEAGEMKLLTAKINIRETEIMLQNILDNRDNMKRKLLSSLGLEKGTQLNLTGEEKYYNDIRKKINRIDVDFTDKKKLFELLNENNPQLNFLRKRRELTEDKIQWEKRKNGLKLDTNAGYNYNQSSDKDYWEFGFNVSYDIFDGGADDIAFEKVKIELNNIEEDYHYSFEQLKIELDNLLDQYYSALKRLNVSKMKEKKVRMELEKAELQLKKGIISDDDRNKQVIALKEAETDLKEARADILIKKLQILQFVGLY